MLSTGDRDWLTKTDLLDQLQRHLGWQVYVEDCLEPQICGLQDILLNDPKEPLPPAVEAAQMHAVRLLLKTLVLLRSKPGELAGTADRIKAEMGTWGRYADELDKELTNA